MRSMTATTRVHGMRDSLRRGLAPLNQQAQPIWSSQPTSVQKHTTKERGLLSLHFDTSNSLYYPLYESILPMSCVFNWLVPPQIHPMTLFTCITGNLWLKHVLFSFIELIQLNAWLCMILIILTLKQHDPVPSLFRYQGSTYSGTSLC